LFFGPSQGIRPPAAAAVPSAMAPIKGIDHGDSLGVKVWKFTEKLTLHHSHLG
jgi:hypothetical protein